MDQFQQVFFLILISWFVFALAERSTYIIHMDKSFMPKAFSTHHHWYHSLLRSAKSEDFADRGEKSGPRLVHGYGHAFHGFSAVMSGPEVEAVRKSPGFLSAYPDGAVTPDTTHSYKFLHLNAATGLWPASEYGKDVIVGVVDSGVWPESPSFHDRGMGSVPAAWKGICQQGDEFNSSLCNRKLVGARYFNAGSRANNPNTKIAVNSARDTTGHGTHVASTAAGSHVDGVSFFGYASGRARGVAPRARLAIYKVAGWEGGSYESDLLAGIDQAVADGVDILSISLSSSRSHLYEHPIAIAGFGARAKGIFVSVSAGNRGPAAGSLLGGIPWAVTVASGTIDRWFGGTLTLGNGKTISGWTMFPARALVRNARLVYNETLSACTSSQLLEAPDRSIIICSNVDRSSLLSTLLDDLSRSRVRAAIIVSEETRRSASFPYPGVVITPSEAEDVIAYASSDCDAPTASIDFLQTIVGLKAGAAPALSASSSRGPGRSYRAIMKPDIMAPGELILAASNPYAASEASITSNILLPSDYTLPSSTSLACPHVSGIAALLKAAHPEWSPAAIQSAMMTTADSLDNTNQPIKDTGFDNLIATPLGMGAGHVNPNRALEPGLIYDATVQDYANLVCSMNFTSQHTQTIIRSSYKCTNPSSDLNYPSFIALYKVEVNRTTVARFKRTLTNVEAGAATYKVKVKAPKNSRVIISPETLAFRKKYDKQSYRVTVHYTSNGELESTDGSITWIEVSSENTVRSPIVIHPETDSDE